MAMADAHASSASSAAAATSSTTAATVNTDGVTTSSSKPTTTSKSNNSRPIHPAFLTAFGPGKGSGSSELSAWAYLTRPRPTTSASSSSISSLPNLVTAHSNSLRIYTVLPHAGTLALTAVYDNLAGAICSLDVIPRGTSTVIASRTNEGNNEDGAERRENATNTAGSSSGRRDRDLGDSSDYCYDGLLLGFSGQPRLSLVYPSAPMMMMAYRGGTTTTTTSSASHHHHHGCGGVLLASSIIDLTSALMERSIGGTSFLEQDMIVTVLPAKKDEEASVANASSPFSSSNTTATTVGSATFMEHWNITDEEEEDPPSVSVVLGGGVAIASFSLPKGPRPCEGGDTSSSSSSSWWRVASEPYVLPLSLLSAKTRDLGCGTTTTLFGTAGTTTTTATNVMSGRGSGSRTNPDTAVGLLGPSVGHGMGDIIDAIFLSGYIEPTLLVLHSNPKRGGGRAWSGRLGRTAEVPLTTTTAGGDEYGDDDGTESRMNTGGNKSSSRMETTLMPTGTKYGLTLTAISLALHQHRSVVLWSLIDAMPADAWKLIPHTTSANGDGGVLVWGVNTIVYVSMGGKIRCALAVNGFAKVGCPPGLLPPPPSPSPSSRGRLLGGSAVHLEANPSPLPSLAIQLDGASRASFVTDNVALVCLGNGTLLLLELHNHSSSSKMKMFMSLFPLGHKIGGLGSVTSCLSVFQANTPFYAQCVSRYLGEEDVDNQDRDESVVSSTFIKKPSSKIQARGLIFVGSRMGDCTLLAFSMNEPIRLISTNDIDHGEKGADKSGGGLEPDVIPSLQSSISAGGSDSGEPMRKQPRIEKSHVVKILDDETGDGYNADSSHVLGHTDQSEDNAELTREEVRRLEEEELYRMDDIDAGTAPSIISSNNDESDTLDNEEINEYYDHTDEDDVFRPRATQRSIRYISMFQSIRALDSLTGLGPLGGGCYGPVATCPLLTEQDANTDLSSWHASESQHMASFSNAFSSAARHYIMPCGFGSSGGLAIVTTPGRDNIGGSILCESDLCNMAGPIFGLPQSNLVLLGKADGVGSIVLRGVLRKSEGTSDENIQCVDVEEFEEVVVGQAARIDCDDAMGVDTAPSFDVASDILGKMTLLAAAEFCSIFKTFSVFFVQAPRPKSPHVYAIVIMSIHGENKESDLGLMVDFVHYIDDDESKNSYFSNNNARGTLDSITPIVGKFSDGDLTMSSVILGCVWSSGNASIFEITLSEASKNDNNKATLLGRFNVSESVFVGNCDDDVDFYNSSKIAAMDIIPLPNHVFDTQDDANERLPITDSSVLAPDFASSLSFPPDRLSMHGTWCAKLDDSRLCQPLTPTLSHSRIAIVICRRSGLLQIYDHEAVVASPIVKMASVSPGASPSWQAHGCSHGTAILGESPQGASMRRPNHHEVEASEIRLFVTGPSLQPESTSGDISPIDIEKDTWMLRSLCIIVDTSLGDLHLYSASKNMNHLQFSRVPLSNVSRSSEEASRHFIKLRRKGIVPQAANVHFRPNRLHRFCGISGEDGLFAATPRPLWFVSERGAPTVVSHKSRHVSPAGGRPVPVSGFCTSMPAVFQNARNGFITLHERIGRVGSQRLTLYNGLWDVFAPHGLLPGGGISLQKIPLGVTVRHIEFIDDASISTTSRPVYAMLISHEIEEDQSELNDDGLSSEERQEIKDKKESARVRKQVEADLGGFDVEQEWVEEIEREDCFTIDAGLGLAPSIPSRKYELWLVDASFRWSVLDKYQLDEFEHGTALKVMYLTDVVEGSDDEPDKNLFICVGASVIAQDGEDIASKGRILLFQIKKSKKRSLQKGRNDPALVLTLKSEKDMALGPITSVSSLKSENIHRVVIGAGAEVTVEQWGNGKLTQVGFYHAHMQVQEIVLFKTFFLLSDAYDSLHFLVWRESDRSLTLLAKDYEPTQVFAAGLISRGGAMAFVCHDDRQNLSFLQYSPTDAAARGGNKLVCRADFHMGTQTTSLQSHWCHSSLLFNSCTPSSTLAALKQQDSLFGRLEDDQRFVINFGTTDGSFCSIVPLSEPTYWRLTALQSVMSNALESNCALSHRAWRLYRRSTRRAGSRSNNRMKGVIDGDLVFKFADLSLPEQEDLASSIGSTVGLVMDNLLELGCAASLV